MFRPASEVLKPDPRHACEVYYDPKTGELRAWAVEDWHAPIADIEINKHAPEPVRTEFDKARNAFLYSWFSYELATLAEWQSFATIELAIRMRLSEHLPGSNPPRGLKKLLLAATEHGLLTEQDLILPQQPGMQNLTLVDILTMQRNRLAHGSNYLLPQLSWEILCRCADLVNSLYPPPVKP